MFHIFQYYSIRFKFFFFKYMINVFVLLNSNFLKTLVLKVNPKNNVKPHWTGRNIIETSLESQSINKVYFIHHAQNWNR